MAIVKWEPILPRWWRMPWLDEEELIDYEEGLNVYETDDELVVEAYVPGVSEDEIDVSIEDNVIRIKAQHKEDQKKKKKKVVYRQTAQASYFYSTTIPCPVKTDKAEAVLENGVLKIVLPKAEEAKPKKIAVKAKAK